MILDGIQYVASPHRYGLQWTPELGVFHYTRAGPAEGTVSWFANPLSEASAHFVVSRTGEWTQTVPLNQAAWHAGRSEAVRPSTGECESNVNRWSIGFELANWGPLARDRHGVFWCESGRRVKRYHGPEPVEAVLRYDHGLEVHEWWEPYREEQIESARRLVQRLRDEGIKLELVGHEEVAMRLGRKTDPGPLFPWEAFGRLHCDRRTTAVLL